MSEGLIVRDVLPSGLRLVTERMPHVRSITVGAWLTRGSRHEEEPQSGIAHFVEHMLFKGTATRSAEDIAQQIDSIGGQLDAFTAKEYASYYMKVLDEHLPIAIDLLSDMMTRPAFAPEDVGKEQDVILEEIKMVEDTPDDLVHEIFTQHAWGGHPLGRPILGTPETVSAFSAEGLRQYFAGAYTAPNIIVAAAGNLDHDALRAMIEEAFDGLPRMGETFVDHPPSMVPGAVVRHKDLEQSHVCIGAPGHEQRHEDRYVSYILNTILGGSMSSRLFQNVRERRGLAYAVYSGMSSYRDTGMFSVYAGCATSKVEEVIAVVLEELRTIRREAVSADELTRAKDHLKGSLMLSLENTASRMSHLARQEIYFGRHFTLDETLEGIERVTRQDILRVADMLFGRATLVGTVLGPKNGFHLTGEHLTL
ncbi:MAG: insulinase family protein [Acidobacteriota bacterium]|nr:insulinase family protein [Acidobacteriota bacterium]